MQEDFKIIALVKFNDGVAMVLNRLPEFVYDHIGDTPHLIGSDGILKNAYKHETPKGSFKGFAGRSFFIPMRDGTTKHATGQYWSCGLDGHVEIAFSSIDELKKCYVYRSALVKKEDLEKFMAEYTGCIYPYWDYEKIIKYDDERRYWINKYSALEKKAIRDKAHLIRNVKEISTRLKRAEQGKKDRTNAGSAIFDHIANCAFEAGLNEGIELSKKSVADLPILANLDVVKGHEEAFRAIEALKPSVLSISLFNEGFKILKSLGDCAQLYSADAPDRFVIHDFINLGMCRNARALTEKLCQEGEKNEDH